MDRIERKQMNPVWASQESGTPRRHKWQKPLGKIGPRSFPNPCQLDILGEGASEWFRMGDLPERVVLQLV